MSIPVITNASFASYQTTALESDWSSFFANLPVDLFKRVKKRDGICSVRILTNEETGGGIAVKIFSTKGVEPAHTHYETKQIFIVLDGELTVWKNEGRNEETLKRGEYVFINPGELHGFSGTALVGGVDIGTGTTLDTYEEGQKCPNITPKLSLTPMLPMKNQCELLSRDNRNIEIMAETITSEISFIAESNRMVVVVSGQALKTNQNGDTQKCQPGDFFFVSSNESYTLDPVSKDPAVMIHFNLFK